MNQPERPIMSILGEAVEYTAPEQRAAFLEKACAGDANRRARVEALLQAYEAAGNFLQGKPPRWEPEATVDEVPMTERPGTIIGPYKLMEQIGEGGFGVVFMAEQQKPLRRKVALKILKPGMDTRQVVARFEAERQVLALMDHPNIARVLDAGQTSSGRPYFVMDLVKGLPITDYCDQSQLTPRERLELFGDVCQAVQHAHQKGIIHRDIKPSNVLVTEQDGAPLVKVIDFGIAKALGQQLTDKTLFTGFAQLIGTPLYMSPEQAALSNVDVDTRSDVYSLGVLLYELLTGTTPFDRERFKEVDYDEMRRIIREEEPPKPSTRISTLGQAATTVSSQRGSDPRQLSRLFRGELDWVVMKALEKDRNRRYESASALAADVQRYMADEPLEASPPSAAYRLRKLARRHKLALATAGLLALAALAVAGSAGYVFRDRSTRLAVIAARVQDALDESERLYRAGRVPEALNAARRAAGLLDSAPADDLLAARVREQVQDMETVLKLDEVIFMWGYDRAAEYERLLRDYGIDLSIQSVEEATARIRGRSIAGHLTGVLESNWGGRKDSVRQRALAVVRLADPDSWRDRARQVGAQGDKAALEELGRTAPVDELPLDTLRTIGRVLGGLKPDGTHASQTQRDFLRRAQRRYPHDVWLNVMLADSLWLDTPLDYNEAVGYYRAILALRPKSAQMYEILGRLMERSGRLDDALAYFRKSIECDPKRSWSYDFLAVVARRNGRTDEATAALRQLIVLTPDDPQTRLLVGNAFIVMERFDEAVAECRELIRLRPDSADAYSGLGNALRKKGRTDEAIACYREALRLNPDLAGAHNGLAFALRKKGRLDEAVAEYEEAMRCHPEASEAYMHLARLLATCPGPKFRDAPRAVTLAKRAVELQPLPSPHWNTLGIALYRVGDWNAAVEALTQSVGHSWGDDWGNNAFFLAMAHWQLGEKDKARDLYDKAVAWTAKNHPQDEELKRFRAEAAELLGIPNAPPAKEKPATRS